MDQLNKIAVINDLGEVHSGVTFRRKSEMTNQSYALIKLKDLDGYHSINRQDLTLTSKVEPKERHLLQEGDVIFSSKGQYNYATVIPEGLGKVVAASTFLIIKNLSNNILPEYLSWYINGKSGQDYVSKVRKRTSIPYVSKTNFVNMPVLIPSIETQELIVKVNNLKIQEETLRNQLVKKRKKLIDAKLLDHVNKKAPSDLEID